MKKILSMCLLLLGIEAAHAQPVIPGAAGFGINTPAGRGGTVHKVTNLNTSGSGSLRACVDATGPRVCVFEVAGTINMTGMQHLVIRNSNITIAGQTAPPPGITIRGATLRVHASNVLIQHIHVRPGDNVTGLTQDKIDNFDAFMTAWPAGTPDQTNVIIDHCSFSWSIDEMASTWDHYNNISFLNSIFAEPLNDSKHSKGPHGYGILLGGYPGSAVTLHNNVLAHMVGRNPLTRAEKAVLVNNVIYNWDDNGMDFQGHDDGPLPPTSSSAVGNVFIPGPDTGSAKPMRFTSHSIAPMVAGSKIFLSDIWYNNSAPSDPWTLVQLFGPSVNLAPFKATSAPNGAWNTGLVVRPTAGNVALNYVLSNAGAFPLYRDPIDTRIINTIHNRNGQIINCVAADGSTKCQKNAGGWPSNPTVTRTLTLPSNPNFVNPDGYTNLEKWLHAYSAAVEGSGNPPPQQQTVFSAEDSYLGDSTNWEPLTPSRWTVSQVSGNYRYGINTSAYEAQSGDRLGEYALVKNRTYRNFKFQMKVASTDDLNSNPGADYAIIFGYQNANNYYYMMLNGMAQNNQLFKIVNGTRQLIANASATFTNNSLHNVEVENNEGNIKVRFNGNQIVSAFDHTFESGRIGVGSYNDKADWDDFKIEEINVTQFSTADTYLGNSTNWESMTPSRWAVVNDGGNQRYGMIADFEALSGDRLGELAILKNRTYENFQFDAKVRSTENLTTNPGADLAVVFGYQDANNYYYVMYNSASVNNALFKIVNGNRILITSGLTPAFSDNDIHSIRVQRQDGVIQAYFDGSLMLEALDGTFGSGSIGIGGYNDRSLWDDMTVTTLPSNLFSTVDLYLNNSTNYTTTTPSMWQLFTVGSNVLFGLNNGDFTNASGDRLGQLALINNRTYGNFTFQVKARSVENLPTNPGADHALVFGYTNANNYYYVMVNELPANTQFFRIQNGVRQAIGSTASVNTVPDNNLHTYRLVRNGTAFTLSMDGNVVLQATISNVPTGQLGVGAYNDQAQWDDITITSP